MTKSTKETIRELSKQYVMKQLKHLDAPFISRQEVDRAIDKVSKALLEVKAAQHVAMKK